MTINEAKDKVQIEALTAWANTGFNGTINLPTGTGKSRCIVLAAGRHIRKGTDERWLVVVPKERLRDVEIPSEFKKWGYKKELNKGVTVECIQTACKRKNEHWDGLCVDEIHRTLSPEHIKLFENNTFGKKLGLSATVEDKDKQELLKKIAPIIYKKTVAEALELGLISDYRIFNLEVPFTAKELSEYKINQEAMTISEEKLVGNIQEFLDLKEDIQTEVGEERREKLVKAYKAKRSYESFSIAMNNVKNPKEAEKSKRNYSYKYMSCMRKRKTLCNNAINKIVAAQKIRETFPERYGLFFSEVISLADRLHNQLGENSTVYHSKLNKKEKDMNLNLYSDKRNKVNFLCTAKALNEGFNLEEVSLGICGSGNSKQLDLIQQLGRTIRIKLGKIAIFVNLYIPNTQDEVWVSKRTKDQNPIWINSIDQLEIAR